MGKAENKQQQLEKTFKHLQRNERNSMISHQKEIFFSSLKCVCLFNYINWIADLESLKAFNKQKLKKNQDKEFPKRLLL